MDTPKKVPGAEVYEQVWKDIAAQQARLEQQFKELQERGPGAAPESAPVPRVFNLLLVPGEIGKAQPVLNLEGLSMEQFATLLLAVVNIIRNTPAAGWQLFASTPLGAAAEAK